MTVLKFSLMENRKEGSSNRQIESDLITIMLADDHPLVRQALKNLMETQDRMRVVAEAANGEDAVKLAEKLQPDVIIMDIENPALNGLEATRQIKTRFPRINILVLAVHSDKEHILGFLNAGATGYLSRVIFGEDLIRAIDAVSAGASVITPSILRQILKLVPREPTITVEVRPGVKLTPRKQFILMLVARGMSNKEIAVELNLSLRTIKAHLAEIFSIIGVSSRTEAIVTGLKSGFISVDKLG
jgi:DNA-binding NarL/FixJ family response regulator